MYHYVMTDEYPYSIGCFKGTPVSTGMRMADAGPPQGQLGVPPAEQQQGLRAPRRRVGGNDPLADVARDLGVDVEALRRAVGAPPPNLRRASQQLGIDIQTLRTAFMRHRPG